MHTVNNVVELKTTGQRVQLRTALKDQTLVRLWRAELEQGSFCGYVCGVGREFFLLYMQELSRDAEWMHEVSFFSWDEVSTVSLEDGYALSLLDVAGPPPPLKRNESGEQRVH